MPAVRAGQSRDRARRRLLGRAQGAGRAIEHGVDELVAFGRAELLRELDAFVDHDAVRHVEMLPQFLQTRSAARRARRGRAARRAGRVIRRASHRARSIVSEHALQQLLTKYSGSTSAYPSSVANWLRSSAKVWPVICHWYSACMASRRDRLRARPGPVAAPFRHSAARRRSRFAISSATIAASAPLLPALVPARSTACSIVSVVSTPNAIGMPVSSAARARPDAHWPATSRNAAWRRGSRQPSATIASAALGRARRAAR